MNDDTETNPQADTETAAPEVAAPEAETEDAPTEEASLEGEGQSEEDEAEELDLNGKKYVIPKAVKPLVMMQQDYTKKTQAHAEAVRQWEETTKARDIDFQAQARFVAENVEAVTQITAIDQQLAQFAKVDWEKLWASDVGKAGALNARRQQLQDARAELAGTLDQRMRDHSQKQQAELAKRIEEGRAQLSSKIPGWTEQRDKQAREFAVKMGMAARDVETIINPTYMQILDLARIGQELSTKARAAAQPKPNASTQPEVEAKPVPTVGARKSPGNSLPSDKDDMQTWVKKERARMARQNAAIAGARQ